ncbi:stress-induced protein, partial [Enterococcus faecium]
MANNQTNRGNQGGTAQNNPGNFANDPQRASEAGQKGGQMSGGRPEGQQTGHGRGSHLQEDDPQRAGGATQRGGQGGHSTGIKSDREESMDDESQAIQD